MGFEYRGRVQSSFDRLDLLDRQSPELRLDLDILVLLPMHIVPRRHRIWRARVLAGPVENHMRAGFIPACNTL